jgi:hypothetical protein
MSGIGTALTQLAVVIIVMMAGGSAFSQSIPVDLRLVLAVDVSRSINAEEQRLQREGYALAFRNPLVLEAIRRGPFGAIAVTYVEWAGEQHVTVPWTFIDGPSRARAFARAVTDAPIRTARRTSISEALIFSAGLFEDRTFAGPRRVIDISGDGPNNLGRRVEKARDTVVTKGITINGLPILLRTGSLASFFDMKNLDFYYEDCVIYYEDCVIGGPGAFIVPVTGSSGFAAGILRKIILEIAGLTPAEPGLLVPAASSIATAPTDCLLGEKLWRRFMVGSRIQE